jgi:hypothetical protein
MHFLQGEKQCTAGAHTARTELFMIEFRAVRLSVSKAERAQSQGSQTQMVERVRRERLLLPASKKPKESSGDAERAKVAFFGPPPLLAGENAADYDEFLEQVVTAVKPTGALERIWVRDFAYHDWEAIRLRRLKTTLINEAFRDSLSDELCRCSAKETGNAVEPLAEDDSDATLAEDNGAPDPSDDEFEAASELARRWVAGDRDAKNEIRKIFATAGRDIEEVVDDAMTTALMQTMEDVERVDRKIMTAESRRNAVVREVDRHRAMLGLQFRRPTEQIHDAEYKVIEDGKAKDGTA